MIKKLLSLIKNKKVLFLTSTIFALETTAVVATYKNKKSETNNGKYQSDKKTPETKIPRKKEKQD